ncbi:MAG: hypothetical protein ABJN34_09280 [Litoreibacter sp.]|uniref:hypothetical protein n=1 Tax=Litoreibacter sp. TaxID=1969459 RepID=UPI00329739C5
MKIIGAILNRIQLFLFAFTVAAASLVCSGMTAGRIENSETYVGLAQMTSELLKTHTTLLDTAPNGEQAAVLGSDQGDALVTISTLNRK